MSLNTNHKALLQTYNFLLTIWIRAPPPPPELAPSARENVHPAVFNLFRIFLLGRRGVTLGKPDIKVETINKETHSLEEDSGSVSTASRMVKAMYSVSSRGMCVLVPDTVYTACSRRKNLRFTQQPLPALHHLTLNKLNAFPCYRSFFNTFKFHFLFSRHTLLLSFPLLFCFYLLLCFFSFIFFFRCLTV